ncbi:hypothetical protein QQF64_011521 [Cirrhinus molitorella]|uniref:Uncharacterized protein n=1 Tax=Cirrhinus molitorella TaxID=172907 RepID=A0ABR3LZG1_9TELE
MQDFTGHPLSARSPVTSRLPSILCHVFSVGSKKAAHPGQCRLASVFVCVCGGAKGAISSRKHMACSLARPPPLLR